MQTKRCAVGASQALGKISPVTLRNCVSNTELDVHGHAIKVQDKLAAGRIDFTDKQH